MTTGALNQAVLCNSIVFPPFGGQITFQGVGSVNFTPDGVTGMVIADGGTLVFGGGVTFTDSSGMITMSGGGLTSESYIEVKDDVALACGSSTDAKFMWETADANANALILNLPAGGATNVPVVAIGQSIETVDLGLYNGVVDPRIALFGVGAVTTAPVLEFRKARGTIAAPTVVTTGDDLGTLDFYGAVAAGEYVRAASIRADMAGTIATTRGPGTLTFLTATDVAPSVLTAALTLGADQSATFGSNITTPGNIVKTGGSATALTLKSVSGTFTAENDTSIIGSTQIPAGAAVVGVTARIKPAFDGTAASLKLGTAGDDDAWGTGIALALDTTVLLGASTASGLLRFAAATDILLQSTDANPIGDATPAGLMTYTIFYYDVTAPTVA